MLLTPAIGLDVDAVLVVVVVVVVGVVCCDGASVLSRNSEFVDFFVPFVNTLESMTFHLLPFRLSSNSILAWIGAPKRERQKDFYTFTLKYYRCAKNQSADMTIALKNKSLFSFFTVLNYRIYNITGS